MGEQDWNHQLGLSIFIRRFPTGEIAVNALSRQVLYDLGEKLKLPIPSTVRDVLGMETRAPSP
jgi:hypothetical protein